MSDIKREKTLLEELKDLDIQESDKKRLIEKCTKLTNELEEKEFAIFTCNRYASLADTRISILEQTLTNICVEKYGKTTWQYDDCTDK